MAQAPVSLKLSLPQRPGMTPRTGIVQVLQTNQSAVRPFSPIVSNNQMNTNTAIQYVRNPPEMTVLNAGNTFVATPLSQQPYGQFGTPLMAFNPNLMQTMASGVPQAVGSGQLGVAASGTGLSNLAGGRKPCNCTKSHCLKLYCECFAQGQLCQNCNCNNCMNNLNYEEERGRAIKMTLERNPTAFHPKIGRGEGERKHTKGCNCKRSGCLKNYCECYEAKISCSDLCRCQGCRNTEDSVERRSLMRLAAMGSLGSRQPSSFKKNLVKPHPETLPHVFFTWEVIEATVTCLIAQAGEAERRDLPPAAQERIILEEFGRILGHVIDSASKAQVRPPSAALHTGDSDSEHPLLHGIPSASSIPMARREERNSASTVGAAAAAAAAADVLLGDDDDEDDEEMMREIGVDDEDDDQGDMDDDMYDDDDEDIGGSHRYRSHRPSHHSHRRITPHRSLQRHRVPGLLDEEMLSDDEPLGRSTGVSSLMSSRYRHTHSSRSKAHSMNL